MCAGEVQWQVRMRSGRTETIAEITKRCEYATIEMRNRDKRYCIGKGVLYGVGNGRQNRTI